MVFDKPGNKKSPGCLFLFFGLGCDRPNMDPHHADKHENETGVDHDYRQGEYIYCLWQWSHLEKSIL